MSTSRIVREEISIILAIGWLSFVTTALAEQYNNQIFSSDGDKLNPANSKQNWESSFELSLFWINTEAVQIFLSLFAFSPGCGHRQRGLSSLNSADMMFFLLGWL